MRTESVPTAAARPGEGNAEAKEPPRREGRLAFEAALRRAGRGPLGDEPDRDAQAPAEPTLLAPTLAQSARPTEPTPAPWAPQAVRAPDALTRQLQAAPDLALPLNGRWQLQILQSGLPAQSFAVQQNPTGPLNVVLNARPEVLRTQPTERLRQRLASRTGAPATLDFRPTQEHDE